MEKKGYIHVYTGNGKGKTTAAIGLAIRAAGRGKKTYIGQFLKKGKYGEIILIKKYLRDFIKIDQFGLPSFHHQDQGIRPEETEAAMNGIKKIQHQIDSRKYDILIMDEINLLLHFNIVNIEYVLTIIDEKPPEMELILTGRYAPQLILDRADLITEMREIKHYYQQQVPARQGIEK